MLKVIGDFSPYGSEFLKSYPHLVERSQLSRSSNDVDFSKLLDTTMKRNPTSHDQPTQPYQLSSVPWSISKKPTDAHQIMSIPQLQNTFPVDEELYVQNNTVIWSRGRHIVKTFQYELQSVELALFAWFPVDQRDTDNDEHSFVQANEKRRKIFGDEQHVKTKKQRLATPLTDLEQKRTKDHISYPPEGDISDTSDDSGKTLQKAACILLKDCMKIHFMDGKHYSIHLPFTVRQVIPSDVGLIFERANYNGTSTSTNRRSKNSTIWTDNMNSYTGDSRLPFMATSTNHFKASPFLCLLHPAEDLKPIFYLDDFSQSSSTFEPGFFQQQQQLVYASFTMDYTYGDNTRSPTLVVTRSKDTGLHSIWLYQTVKNNEIDSSDDDGFNEETRLSTHTASFYVDVEDQQYQPKQEQGRKIRKLGKRSKKSSLSVKGSKRRPMKQQQQQRQQQQQQQQQREQHQQQQREQQQQQSSPPSPGLTTRKDSFLAASWSFPQNDDEVSNAQIDGNGDSFSMMALYQDALETQKGEKCILKPIWKEQGIASRKSRATASKGFISHNAKGLAMLCIMNETEGTLLGLVIDDLLSHKQSQDDTQQQKSNPVAAFHLAVKQALPIHSAIRSGGVADILYLDHSNNMFLFVDPQLPNLPILSFCEEIQQGQTSHKVIKLQDAVDNRFNMVTAYMDNDGMLREGVKRCQIDAVPADFYCNSANGILIVHGNMALRCAWSSSLLWFFFQHHSLQLLQKKQDIKHGGWEAFSLALLSMIPLSSVSPPLGTSTTTAGAEYDETVSDFYVQCLNVAYQTQHKPQEKEEIYYMYDPQDIASMMYALHVLYQEYRLSKFIPKESLVFLGTLLWVLSQILRSNLWIDFYQDYGCSKGVLFQLDTSSLNQRSSPVDTANHDDRMFCLNTPFHFESWVHYHLPSNYTTSLQQLCGIHTLDPDTVYSPLTKAKTVNTGILAPTLSNRKLQRRYGEFGFKLKMIWYIHQTMYYHLSNIALGDYASASSVLHVSPQMPLKTAQQNWIKAVMKKGYSRNDLEMVPDHCILLDPLLDAMAQLQLDPPTDQSVDFYKFIGRNDMVAQLDHYRMTSNLSNTGVSSLYYLKLLQFSSNEKYDIPQKAPAIDHRGSELILSQLSYGGSASTLDKLKHVRALLNPCRLVELAVPDRPGISQESLDTIIQGYMKHLIQRTLALSTGNAIFHYGHQHLSHLPPSNMKTGLPSDLSQSNTDASTGNGNRSLTAIEEKISMSAKLLPLRTVVTLDEKTYRPEYYNWPRFHHGVATGLRLSSPRVSLSNKDKNGNELGHVSGLAADTGHLDDGFLAGDKNDLCWLFYVEPEELNVFHGGLIFGLGLNGHLLPNSRWYRYITQTKCSLVTIGFILGTCVTFRGTKNSEITKILSVHVPALLNPSVLASTAAPPGTTNTGFGIGASSSSHRMRGEDSLMTSSCLFGFGLIYMGSCDRYMISIMLNEIGNCSKRANTIASGGTGAGGGASISSGNCHGNSSSNTESACALAAGFALGFIALGKGGNVSKEPGGLSDTQLSDTLHNYITGPPSNTDAIKSFPPTSAQAAPSANGMSSFDRYQPGQPQRTERKRRHGQGATRQHYNRGMSNLLDITAPAATVAIGLIYLKTENHRIAGRLDIRETTKPYLNYVRPDFLLMRIVAKNLILWKSITASQAWIDDQLPIFMRPSHQRQRNMDHRDDSVNRDSSTANASSTPAWEDQVINQAKYNVIAGACLCLGLRFAGSHDTKAFECLLSQFDSFMKLATIQATGFQEHITMSAIWTCIDVIATAAAMVMAGSGHEGLYRRLKTLHDRIPFGNVDMAGSINSSPSSTGEATGQGNYGDHTASHMAMGLLFCGLGRYTLKTTNEAIAGLLCAFYPFYPIDAEDQRSHLQALRHLWVMGMDQRWLTPFDCDTKLPCQVPLLIATTSSMKGQVDTNVKDIDNTGSDYKEDNDLEGDGVKVAPEIQNKIRVDNNVVTSTTDVEHDAQTQQALSHCRVVAPSIVPNYDCIQNIQLDSSLYYPLNVNMRAKGDYQQAICQSGVIFVQRRDKMHNLNK